MKRYFEWFYNLSEREQRLVSAAAIVMGIAILYFLVWAPIQQDYDKQQKALAADKALLVWVDEQADKALQLRGTGSGQSYKGSLTQLINSSARRNNVLVSRMQPQGENMQISMDSVKFDDLLTWIAFLQAQGVEVVYSDITETDAEGYVQVRRLQIGKA